MNTLRIFLFGVAALFAASFAACDTPHKSPPKKTAKKSASVRSGAENVGRKTEKTFRHVGGKLEKFFTGHDTISR
ncbi:MAG: hypothetical protein NTV08_05270 [Verrucomicrobia bacterium]|nr:hypothetical protein [Verrucomicrobiota bacterium]